MDPSNGRTEKPRAGQRDLLWIVDVDGTRLVIDSALGPDTTRRPRSIIELVETIGPLTDPTAHGGSEEDAFHLVLPSIPGYGFYDEPTEVGWRPIRIGRARHELMQHLGYTRVTSAPRAALTMGSRTVY